MSYQISVAVDGKFWFRTDWESFNDEKAATYAAKRIKEGMNSQVSGVVEVTLNIRNDSYKSVTV